MILAMHLLRFAIVPISLVRFSLCHFFANLYCHQSFQIVINIALTVWFRRKGIIKITPLDIQQKQFRIKFRGFNILEVDNFLEQLAVSFRSLLQENAGLHEEIKKLKIETQRSQEREKAFEQAMSNSQKALEQMRENARKSADLVVADAEVVAEKMLTRTQNRLAQLHEDIAELKRQRIQIEVQIRSIIETHTKLLEIGKEDMKAMDEEDSKVKLLKKSETTSL